MRRLKAAIIAACVCFSLGAFYTHLSGKIYPGLPIGAATAAILLLVGISYQKSRFRIALPLAAVTALSVGYRLYVFLFPASLIGADPDAYAVQAQAVMFKGSLSAIQMEFYRSAPFYDIVIAMSGMVFGTDAKQAFLIFPIVFGILASVTAAALIRGLTTNNRDRLACIGALIAGMGAVSIHYSYWPVPQMLAANYWLLFILSYSIYRHNSKYRVTRSFGVVLLLLLIGILFTHKLPLLTVTLFGCALLLISHVVYPLLGQPRVRGRIAVPVVALCGVLVVVQWGFLSEYLYDISIKVLVLLNLKSLSIGQPAHYSHAILISQTPLETAQRLLYMITLLAGSGIAWLILLFRQIGDHDYRTILLAASGVGYFSILLGILNSAGLGGFQRMVTLVGGFAAVILTIVAGRILLGTERNVVQITIILLLAVVIVGQLVSIPASPDYPESPRNYLTNDEAVGKIWGNQYANGIVYRGMTYGDEVIDVKRAARTGEKRFQKQVPQPEWDPGLLDIELKNGTVATAGYKYVSIRTDVDIYRLKHSQVRLTYEPENALDPRYNRVYDNGNVITYNQLQS